jgi:transcriptional regulator of arginine metabolism
MKRDRQNKILQLIQEHDVENQEELLAYLRREGFEAAQATVSRDIRELLLTKLPKEGGGQKYVAMKQAAALPEGEKYIRVWKEGFVSMDMAQNILVLKTVSGMAMAVAAAIDAMQFQEVVGCIAGDDTVMAAVRSVEDTEKLMEKLRRLNL